ncbi:unnamed protein product [Sphenostylis stenocarpa]|uniref:Uncharacterized protein n=1 Tax=Sphenostylis stenocarpa TaxID=92480 RepID=A0AA86SVG6_9FABA|nr:unnamed protein product [Sphenostylis stenocarpa]
MNLQLQSKIEANPKISLTNPPLRAHKVRYFMLFPPGKREKVAQNPVGISQERSSTMLELEWSNQKVVSASLTSEHPKEVSRVEQYHTVKRVSFKIGGSVWRVFEQEKVSPTKGGDTTNTSNKCHFKATKHYQLSGYSSCTTALRPTS